jgi:NAD(P) transhydrogenase subunit alpha
MSVRHPADGERGRSFAMKITTVKEVRPGERRVALTPDAASRLVKAGHSVRIEAGAGEGGFFSDASYTDAGAEVLADAGLVLRGSEVALKINPPRGRNGGHEADMLPEGSVLIGFLNPLGDLALIRRLTERQITAFGMELIPRIARAQSMDALTSQASVAGYKAALMAACGLPRFFPLMTTAAGTLSPAKVLVLGAGVAGLQAIATARRLGAVVEAFDIRPAVREEVQSLGARFLQAELPETYGASGEYAKEVSEEAGRRVRELLREHVRQADAVITTAMVPGKRAPVLVTRDMAESMRKGAVIVDLAAEQGGNCELTQPGLDVVHGGVTIMGQVNLTSLLSAQASEMYARNITAFLRQIIKGGALNLDFGDEIVSATCVTHGGEIRNDRVRQAVGKA